MQIHFVTNEQRYSRFFRFLFKEETSHVGTVFQVNNINLALDLNRPYGTLWDLSYWLSKYNIVYTCDIPLSPEDELTVFEDCRKYAVLRKYDMSGYYYGILCGILCKFLHKKLPTVNRWSANTGSMCQEILVPVAQSAPILKLGISIDFKNITAKTPDMAMKLLQKATANVKEITWRYNG